MNRLCLIQTTLVVLAVLLSSCGLPVDAGLDETYSRSETYPTPQITIPEYKEALADIWIEDDHYEKDGLLITRRCLPDDDNIVECELFIKAKGRGSQRLALQNGRKHWLKYGFLDLLGKKDKQLIVLRYSGGAHCCYDYAIYDLSPRIRSIYSTPPDSANVVGNELVPVDIDHDGVQEFHQDVMGFDYWGQGGHATASFPPAVYAYDKSVGRYKIANKHYPEFVISSLADLMIRAEKGEWLDDDAKAEYIVRTRFLYLVYAGKRDEAWNYFDNNYRSRGGNGYQEQFKEQFKNEVREIFSKDPTYLSIYGK